MGEGWLLDKHNTGLHQLSRGYNSLGEIMTIVFILDDKYKTYH